MSVVQVFPYANIVAGVLVLAVGFVFHWIFQLISVFNWDLATRIGVQEKGMPSEYKVYEHAIAAADASIAWVYGIAGVGLVLGTPWGFKLAWLPGAILIYHGMSFWFWSGNQARAGHRLATNAFRVAWLLANLIPGALAILVAWNGC